VYSQTKDECNESTTSCKWVDGDAAIDGGSSSSSSSSTVIIIVVVLVVVLLLGGIGYAYVQGWFDSDDNKDVGIIDDIEGGNMGGETEMQTAGGSSKRGPEASRADLLAGTESGGAAFNDEEGGTGTTGGE